MKSHHYNRIVSIHKKKYSYQQLEEDSKALVQRYPNQLQLQCFGESWNHRKLYCLCFGNPLAKRSVLINAAIHGREWLNAPLLLAMLERYCRTYEKEDYQGIPYQKIFDEVCLFVVPMMNPDGVTISQERHPRCKANARGVDLNRNFEPGFVTQQKQKNMLLSGDCKKDMIAEYGGEYPFSEKETRALIRLVRELKPSGVINYHQTGLMVYYHQMTPMVERVVTETGYLPIKDRDQPYGSFGDWLEREEIPWCTIETCHGRAPVSHWQIYRAYRENRNVWAAVATAF